MILELAKRHPNMMPFCTVSRFNVASWQHAMFAIFDTWPLNRNELFET